MRATRLAIAVLTTLALAACGGGGGGSGGGSGGPELRLTLKDYEFVPKTFDAPANTQIKLVLKNTGSVEHDFTIDQPAIKVLAPTGREVTKTVGPLVAGTYNVHCSVPGHKELGMVATLSVK